MTLSKDNLPPRPDAEMSYLLDHLYHVVDNVNTALAILKGMSDTYLMDNFSTGFTGMSADDIDRSIKGVIGDRPLVMSFPEGSPFCGLIVWGDEAKKSPYKLEYEEFDRTRGRRLIVEVAERYGSEGVTNVCRYLEAAMDGAIDDPELMLSLQILHDKTVTLKK